MVLEGEQAARTGLILMSILAAVLAGCARRGADEPAVAEPAETEGAAPAGPSVALIEEPDGALDARAADTLTDEAFPAWMKRQLAALQWEHRPEERKLTRAILEQSLELGRGFLLANQKPAGNFNYQYHFLARQLSENDSQVRQAGALWGTTLIYQYEQTPEAGAAVEKGLRFFFDRTQPGPVEGTLLIDYPGEDNCKSGTIALVALAVIDYLRTVEAAGIEIAGDFRQELHAKLNGYIEFLKFMQFDDKHFSRDFSLARREKSDRFSPYFDGETLLCLTKAAKYLGRTDLVPLVERSAVPLAKYYSFEQWRTEPDSDRTKGFFQWSCMAFWEYQGAGWENAETLGDYVITLAWWMVHVHRTLRRPLNTAYAYEGIIPAYQLARQRNLAPAVNDLGYAIDTALYRLTSWQVGGPLRSENGFLTAHPSDDPNAVGGIMNHESQPTLRIDVAQHQMHAVVLALTHVYTE